MANDDNEGRPDESLKRLVDDPRWKQASRTRDDNEDYPDENVKKLAEDPRWQVANANEGRPTLDHIKKLAEDPRWGGRVGAAPASDIEQISSKAEALAWCDKYYLSGTVEGKFCIINERIPNKVQFMTRRSFIESLEDKRLREVSPDKEKVTFTPIAELWLRTPSPGKRKFQEIVVDPRPDFNPNRGAYNLWRGFMTKPIEGACPLTLGYFQDVLANGNGVTLDWILDFLAHMRQRPWEKPEVALVMMGPKGVGKTFLMDIVEMLIDGKDNRRLHCYKTSNSQDIFGDFRGHLINRIALLLDEVTWGGDVKHEGMLKDLITGKTLPLNVKHGPMIVVDNLMRIIMAANEGWSIPVSYDERRYMGVGVSDIHRQDHAYFNAIYQELTHGGIEALTHILLKRDISSFNCREAPVTEVLIDQARRSESGIERYIREKLVIGNLPYLTKQHPYLHEGVVGHTEPPDIYIGNDKIGKDGEEYYQVIREKWYDDYVRFQKTIGDKRILSIVEFGRQVYQIFVDKNKKRLIYPRRLSVGERLWVHLVPKLAVCRQFWDKRSRREAQWEEPNEWELPPYT